MKLHIVYKVPDELGSTGPYQMTKVFDDEKYTVFDERRFEQEGVKAISPKPHIAISKIIGGAVVNTVYGDFVSEHEEEREARIAVGRMNDIWRIMES